MNKYIVTVTVSVDANTERAALELAEHRIANGDGKIKARPFVARRRSDSATATSDATDTE